MDATVGKVVRVYQSEEERVWLTSLTQESLRFPGDEFRFLLREEARRRGWLTNDDRHTNTSEGGTDHATSTER
jgi:hypothetical protein